MRKEDEDIILELLKGSDQKAFKRLFYYYAEPLRSFISYFIHDPESSEELVLDIFYVFVGEQILFKNSHKFKSLFVSICPE